MLVNSTHTDSHISFCVQCRDGGELLCCDGCPAAYHPACLGLQGMLQDAAWFCPSCVQVSSAAVHLHALLCTHDCEAGISGMHC